MATYDDTASALPEWQRCSDQIALNLPFDTGAGELERLLDVVAASAG